MLTRSAQHGFSLTELLVASALGLFLLSGIGFALFEIGKTVGQGLMQAHLRQTLTTVMAVISGELRRAGYSYHLPAQGYLPVHLPGDATAASCILYSYDQENNSSDGLPDAGDQGGLRLSNGALQIKTSDSACGDSTCTDCDSGHWLAVTDPATVRITRLTFTKAHLSAGVDDDDQIIEIRRFHIDLDAELVHDPGIRHRLETVLRLPNDPA